MKPRKEIEQRISTLEKAQKNGADCSIELNILNWYIDQSPTEIEVENFAISTLKGKLYRASECYIWLLRDSPYNY